MFPVFSLHFTHTLDLSYFGFSFRENQSTSDRRSKERKKSDPLVINVDSPCAPWISTAVPQDMVDDNPWVQDPAARYEGEEVSDPVTKLRESKWGSSQNRLPGSFRVSPPAEAPRAPAPTPYSFCGLSNHSWLRQRTRSTNSSGREGQYKQQQRSTKETYS